MKSKSSHTESNEVSIHAIEAAAEVARGMESANDEVLTVVGETGEVWLLIGNDHSVKFPKDEEADPLVEALPKSHDTPHLHTAW